MDKKVKIIISLIIIITILVIIISVKSNNKNNKTNIQNEIISNNVSGTELKVVPSGEPNTDFILNVLNKK